MSGLYGPDGAPIGATPPAPQQGPVPQPIAGAVGAVLTVFAQDGTVMLWPLEVEAGGNEVGWFDVPQPDGTTSKMTFARSAPKYVDDRGRPAIGSCRVEQWPAWASEFARGLGFPLPDAPRMETEPAGDGDAEPDGE